MVSKYNFPDIVIARELLKISEKEGVTNAKNTRVRWLTRNGYLRKSHSGHWKYVLTDKGEHAVETLENIYGNSKRMRPYISREYSPYRLDL